MPTSTVKTEGGDVSCETPEGTVINIHISQRSALDCLLETFKTLRRPHLALGSPRVTAPGPRRALGASQITLGCVCVFLAVILCLGPNLDLFWNGALFWVGFPFILSGALSVVADKRTTRCWVLLSTMSQVVSLAVSIAGLVIAAGDLSHWRWFSRVDDICVRRRQRYTSYYHYMTTTPPPSDGPDWDLENCKRVFNEFMYLLLGLEIMIVLLLVWGLCMSLFSHCTGLRTLCCGFAASEEEGPGEKDSAPLLTPPPYTDCESNK